MPILLTILYALHVLCGIAWFGGAIFSVLVLGPAFAKVSGGTMAAVGPRIGAQAGKVMPAAATATLLLGIATAFETGRFTNPSALFADSYGITVPRPGLWKAARGLRPLRLHAATLSRSNCSPIPNV